MITRLGVARSIAVLNAAVLIAASLVAGLSEDGAATSAVHGPISQLDGRLMFALPNHEPNKPYPQSWLSALSPSGGAIDRVTRVQGAITEIVASPDGRRIAFAQQTYAESPVGGLYVAGEWIHTVAVDGRHDRLAYRCPDSTCGDLAWSPDSQQLLIESRGLQVLKPDGHVVALCAAPCAGSQTDEASWSPNGRRLVFQDAVSIKLKGGSADVAAIGVMNADGSNPRLITDRHCSSRNRSGCTNDANPEWSSDGTIAFTRVAHPILEPYSYVGGLTSGPSMIETIRADGTHLHQISPCGPRCSIVNLAWSPSGAELEVTSYSVVSAGQLYSINSVDPDTGQRASIPLPMFVRGDRYPQVAWAPGSDYLTLTGRDSGGSDTPSGVYVIRVQPGTLGPPQRLAADGYPPAAWLPAEQPMP